MSLNLNNNFNLSKRWTKLSRRNCLFTEKVSQTLQEQTKIIYSRDVCNRHHTTWICF